MCRKSEEYQRLKSEWMIYYKNKKVAKFSLLNPIRNQILFLCFPFVDDGGAATHNFNG
jgi:hypothetical protein